MSLISDERAEELPENEKDKDADIEWLKADRDKWEYECKIAYKAFDESNVKKMYEDMHQADIEEHNRMLHEIAILKELLTRAADALEKYTSYPIGMAMSVSLRESGRSILKELRKTAPE